MNNPKWVVWGKQVITGPNGGTVYLKRWILFRCPLFQVMVHKFHRGDERVPHDHPWPFVSLVLWGKYYERLGEHCDYEWLTRRAGTLAFRRATDRHYVDLPAGRHCWTLVITGRRQRKWGFWPSDNHFIPYDQYISADICEEQAVRAWLQDNGQE